MTLLLKYVSGVPYLEKRGKKKAEFRVYMEETNCMIPWFYKEIAGDERISKIA